MRCEQQLLRTPVCCERESLGISPRWCRTHLGMLVRAMLPALAGASACAFCPWLPAWIAPTVCVLFVVSLLLELERRPLDLPPLSWRVHALFVPGASLRATGFRCPGCGRDASSPTDRTRYRCRSVEFEVRGARIWFVPSEFAPRSVDGLGPSAGTGDVDDLSAARSAAEPEERHG